MKVHTDLIQGSQEWLDARAGVITASEIGPFVFAKNATAEKARFKYLCDKIGELDGEIERMPPNAAMRTGTALEPIVRQVYEEQTGKTVEEVGFITHDRLPLGCSPDGIIVDADGVYQHGLEIKSPSPGQHVHCLLRGELPEQYKFQVHMSMIVAELPRWDFYTYRPKVTRMQKDVAPWIVREWEHSSRPPFHIVVERDSFTDQLERALNDLCLVYERMKSQMADLYDKHQAEIQS